MTFYSYKKANLEALNNHNNNTSPSSSKNSSSDSLNYILRKDSLTEPNSSNMVNTNSEFSNFTKKKSLKTTLYRIFTQRKKSKIKIRPSLKNKHLTLMVNNFFQSKSLELFKKVILNWVHIQTEIIQIKINSL